MSFPNSLCSSHPSGLRAVASLVWVRVLFIKKSIPFSSSLSFACAYETVLFRFITQDILNLLNGLDIFNGVLKALCMLRFVWTNRSCFGFVIDSIYSTSRSFLTSSLPALGWCWCRLCMAFSWIISVLELYCVYVISQFALFISSIRFKSSCKSCLS